jgi:hypothetical protein
MQRKPIEQQWHGLLHAVIQHFDVGIVDPSGAQASYGVHQIDR